MTEMKLCPFINGNCTVNCAIYNSNTNCCTIPLLNSNIFKLMKQQEKLENLINKIIASKILDDQPPF